MFQEKFLLLTDMPEISVDSEKQPHGYGIQAEQDTLVQARYFICETTEGKVRMNNLLLI